MANFGINLDLQLRNQGALARAVKGAEQLEAIYKRISDKGLDLGNLGNADKRIREARKSFVDLADAVLKGEKSFGQVKGSLAKTETSLRRYLDAFKTLQANTSLDKNANDFNKYAKVIALVEDELNKLAVASENAQRAQRGMPSIEEEEKQLKLKREQTDELNRQAKARRRNAKAAKQELADIKKGIRDSEKAQEKARRKRERTFNNLGAGVGFPLLFGGGPGSVIGGGVGALFGGFGGSVIGGAIGQQLDKLGSSALEVSKVFGTLGASAEGLIPLLGRGTSGGFGANAQFLAARGRESEVAEILRDRFDEVYGEGAARRFEDLAKTGKEFDQVLQELGVGFKGLMAGPLGGLLELLKGFSPAGGVNETAFVQENRDRAARISQLLTRQGEKGGLSLNEKRELDTLSAEVFTRGQTGVDDSDAKAKLEKLYNDELKITKDLQKQETDLLSIALTAGRDILATKTGELAIEKSTSQLNKLKAQLLKEEAADKKDILRIAELNEKIAERQANLDRDKERKRQAEILAERAIQTDLRANLVEQNNIQLRVLDVDRKIFDFSQRETDSYKTLNTFLDRKYYIQEDSLKIQRKQALVGVNELKVQNAINKTFDDRRQLLLYQLSLQKEAARQAQLQRFDSVQADADALALNEQLERDRAQQAINSTDPFRAFSFSGTGLGFFAESELFKANTLEQSAMQLERYNEQIAALISRITELQKSNADPDTIDPLRKNLKQLTQTRDLYEELQPSIDQAAIAQARYNDALAITTPLTDSLFDSLIAVVEGTKTAEQAFADFLRSIADMLFQAAKQMIAQYIAIGIARMFAGMGSPASAPAPDIQTGRGFGLGDQIMVGGMRTAASGKGALMNQPYLVGERGPELFVPKNNGTIVPNHQMGGSNIVVNVDASGSSVEGDSEQASQLGKMLGAAVQAELIKQKRPGGLLA